MTARKYIGLILPLAVAAYVLAGCASTDPYTADPYQKAKMRTTLYNEGSEYYKARDYEQAALKFKEAMKWVPDDFKSNLKYGWCMYSIGMKEFNEGRALKDKGKVFNQSTHRMEPTNEYSAAQMTRFELEGDKKIQAAESRFKEGLRYAQRALSLKENADVYHLLVNLYFFLNEHEKTKDAIRKILDDPSVKAEFKEPFEKILKWIEAAEKEYEDYINRKNLEKQGIPEDDDFGHIGPIE